MDVKVTVSYNLIRKMVSSDVYYGPFKTRAEAIGCAATIMATDKPPVDSYHFGIILVNQPDFGDHSGL